jgi:hypothetical protein
VPVRVLIFAFPKSRQTLPTKPEHLPLVAEFPQPDSAVEEQEFESSVAL